MTQVTFSKRSVDVSVKALEFDNPAHFFQFCIDQDYVTEFAPLDVSTVDSDVLSVIQNNSRLSDDHFIDITHR